MNAYDRWLEEPYDSSWDNDDDDSKEFCQDEYMTNEEIQEYLADILMEEQYELHINAINTP